MPHDFERYVLSPALLESDFKTGAFKAYYQPQYDHTTGLIIGAEALARYVADGRVVAPNDFIGFFEKNGLITTFDLLIFEQVCAFLRRTIDRSRHIIPVSVNFSRLDICRDDIISRLEEIRSRYDVPAKLLHIEITESSTMGGLQLVQDFIRKLHALGYAVEIDDFGSGYSSLNMLKDIPADCIKLDMAFLRGDIGGRGGTILSSVVRMAKWLGTPVIAEGVETKAQADFLRSIGCYYLQGYLYARPMPEEELDALLGGNDTGVVMPQLELIETFNAANFWDPRSLETLIFNNFVGGAAIFELDADDNVELLRVNRKYLEELGMNLSEKELIEGDAWAPFDEQNRRVYLSMLHRAEKSGEEEECETLRTIRSACCGSEQLYLKANVRMIGRSPDGRCLFYSMLRNTTAERVRIDAMSANEQRFSAVVEQAKIYYWEYTIATKEMRPCFRCMRDFGLPPLVPNYPEPVIEAGIFPSDIADLYRDWHRRLAEGEASLDAVLPLTADHIPYRVRYTTVRDKTGRPVKAYGSAAPIDLPET